MFGSFTFGSGAFADSQSEEVTEQVQFAGGGGPFIDRSFYPYQIATIALDMSKFSVSVSDPDCKTLTEAKVLIKPFDIRLTEIRTCNVKSACRITISTQPAMSSSVCNASAKGYKNLRDEDLIALINILG